MSYDLSFIERLLDEAEAAVTVKVPEVKRQRIQADDQARRDDCTILVLGLHPSADERDVYEYFSREAGKIRDVQVIKDSRTGKSKGVAYVEFYLSDSILKALACNGQVMKGVPLRVQSAQAEKNRAAEAQRIAQMQEEDKPMTLYVAGMIGPMVEFTEADVKRIFACFGSVDGVNIKRCPYSGRSLGVCYVHFKKATDAREAMACMHGYEIEGLELKVGYVSSMGGVADVGGEETSTVSSQQQRTQLMTAMLTGEATSKSSNMQSCLVLQNMFDQQVLLRPDANRFFEDIKGDIEAEVIKHGRLSRIWIDKMSRNGSVWLELDSPDSAQSAWEALEGRLFRGRQVTAKLVDKTTLERALVT